MLFTGRSLLMGSLVASTLPLAACASVTPPTPPAIRAGSAIGHGTVVVHTAGTYDYVLMSGCQSFKFSSDGGNSEWLEARGAVRLGAGLWTGACYRATLDVPSSTSLACMGQAPPNCTYSPGTAAEKVSGAWSLILSAIGSSY